MAHFAELDSNNVVTRVIVVADSDTTDENGTETEAVGVAYLKGLFGEHTKWAQTSYNSNMRLRYAGPGSIFDAEKDCFLAPKPFDSWTLNSASPYEWEAPITMPTTTTEMDEHGIIWEWDEEAHKANSSEGWVLSQPIPAPTPTE